MDTNSTHPLRALRYSLNMSIEDLAEVSGVSVQTIKRAEKGQGLYPDSRRLLCEYLNKSPEELGLLPQKLRAQKQQLEPAEEQGSGGIDPLQAIAQEMFIAMQHLENGGIDMKYSRRSLFQLFAAAGVALAASQKEALLSHASTAAELYSPITEVSESAIESLTLITQRYRSLQLVGLATEEGLRSHIALIQNALENTLNDKYRRELWRLLAQSQLLARHSITKKRELGRARTWNESAIASAQYSGDALLLGAALGHLGHLYLTWQQDPVFARQLISQAQNYTGRHPVSGWFAMVLAAIAATEGNQNECEGSVAKATEIVRGMPGTPEFTDL